MNIVVTGGAGFIGSNIVDAYIAQGHNVVVIDNLSSGKKSNLNRKAVFYCSDIRDKAAVEEIIRKHKIEAISHHAAQIDVRKAVEDPEYDSEINILAGIRLLETAAKAGVKKLIFSSSGGAIYSESQMLPFSEESEAEPLSQYGVSKLAFEYYIRCYSKLYGIKHTILRYSNVYGIRQNTDGEAGVVAIFASRMLQGKSCNIFGDGKQTRDYVYVGDVAKANILALEKADNQTINIGTGKETSVNELFRLIAKACGYTKEPCYMPERKGELKRSCLSIEKAKSALGWEPETTIEEGIKKTIDFIKSGASKNG